MVRARSSRWMVVGVFGAFAGQTANAGVFPYPVHHRELPNGVDVVVVPMPSPGVIAIGTWMHVGSRDEVVAGRTGFAHFFEHLMFLGTPDVSGDARERSLLQLGVEDNAWTWMDETVYHLLAPRSALAPLLRIEADRFQHLQLTPDQVRREAGAVYGELRKGLSDPWERVSDRLHEVAFSTHTYHHSTIGFETDIKAMPEAWSYAQTFFQQHYRPDRATVLLVGDITPEDGFAEVERTYGAWVPAAVPAPAAPTPEPPQQGIRREELKADVEGSQIALGWRIPGGDPSNPDVAALAVLDAYWMSESGPLVRRLVREEGLAYAVDGGREDFVDPCLFVVQVELAEGADVARVEAIVREELARVAEGLPDEAVERAREHARYAFLVGLDRPMDTLLALGWAMRRGGVDAIDTFYRHFDAVGSKEVAGAARRWLVDTGLTVITLGADGGAR